jgi:hypothetical protein
MVRGQRLRGRGELFTAKSVLSLLAIVAMIGSSIYWWGVQSQLTDNMMMAIAFTAILVLAPPVLTSFLIPWSPGGMLLQKINAKTWGYIVVILAALYLLYYSFEIQYSWWATQQVVADTGLVLQQVIIGIIGFIIIPALLWTPVTSEELVEQVRQAHLVKRYEIQTQADIAIMRNTLLRAQEKALIGFANLSASEKEELAAAMRGLVSGIDQTLQDIGKSVKTVSGATLPFSSLKDNDEIQGYLDYIHDSLTGNALAQVSGKQDVDMLADPRDQRDDQLDVRSSHARRRPPRDYRDDRDDRDDHDDYDHADDDYAEDYDDDHYQYIDDQYDREHAPERYDRPARRSDYNRGERRQPPRDSLAHSNRAAGRREPPRR